MSGDNSIHLDFHRPEITDVVELYTREDYPDRPDDDRTVTVRLGDVTLFFQNAVRAHDFGTELHAAIENLPSWRT